MILPDKFNAKKIMNIARFKKKIIEIAFVEIIFFFAKIIIIKKQKKKNM